MFEAEMLDPLIALSTSGSKDYSLTPREISAAKPWLPLEIV